MPRAQKTSSLSQWRMRKKIRSASFSRDRRRAVLGARLRSRRLRGSESSLEKNSERIFLSSMILLREQGFYVVAYGKELLIRIRKR